MSRVFVAWLIVTSGLWGCAIDRSTGFTDVDGGASADVGVGVDGGVGVDAGVDTGPPPGACDTAPAGLVACYTFDGDLMDRGPHGLHALSVAAATFEASPRGQALRPSGDLITVADNATLDLATVTVELWVQSPGVSDYTVIMDNNDQYALAMDPDRLLAARMYHEADPPLITGSALGTNAWHHVAVTDDGSVVQVYLDGAVTATMSFPNPLRTADTEPMHIGTRSPEQTLAWLGLLDEMRIYDRALTPEEICRVAARTWQGNSCT